jgi:hypothetical protein
MTPAVPKAIHPIVPAESPAHVFFPAASPAFAAPLSSESPAPGWTGFFGQTSHSSAADAGDIDPSVTVRKQAAHRIATTHFHADLRRFPLKGTSVENTVLS